MNEPTIDVVVAVLLFLAGYFLGRFDESRSLLGRRERSERERAARYLEGHNRWPNEPCGTFMSECPFDKKDHEAYHEFVYGKPTSP